MNEQLASNSQAQGGGHKPIRIALIGAGKIARDAHVPALYGNQAFALLGVVDPCTPVPGIAHYQTFGGLMAAEADIEAVAICTPPAVRTELARQAIDAGLHVLLEKPPASSTRDLLLLSQHAERSARTLFTAWHSREAAGVAPARAWLAQRHIQSINVHWHEHVDVFHPGQSWIRKAGGYGVFDPGINALSILVELFGDRIAIARAKLRTAADWDAPVGAQLSLILDGTTIGTASLALDATEEPQWRIDIETDAGALILDEGGAKLTICRTPVPLIPTPEYPALYTHFARLIREGRSDIEARPLSLVEQALGRTDADAAPVA